MRFIVLWRARGLGMAVSSSVMATVLKMPRKVAMAWAFCLRWCRRDGGLGAAAAASLSLLPVEGCDGASASLSLSSSSFASSCSVKCRLSRFALGGLAAAWLACEVELCECGCEFCVWFAEEGCLCLVDLAFLGFSCVASRADVDCGDDGWLACDLIRLGVEGVLLS